VVRISRQELARNAGCSREMAGRVLKKLEEDGLVQSQGRSIVVLTPVA
jgi:CRP/FNR family cyclic AMP-dependent transcriptional regulator